MMSALARGMALLLLAGLAQAADTPRKPHPFAPSLPALSDEQEAAFDKIVDNFILYDVGALKGEEGKRALLAFKTLPPEAVFALIRGLNKAAAIEDSCPAVVIGKKLNSLLRGTTDAQLLDFAYENIGAGIKHSRHMGVIQDLRVICIFRKRDVDRMRAANPRLVPMTPGGVGERKLLLIKPIASLDQTTLGRLRKMSVAELHQEAQLSRGSKLRPILIEIEKRQGEKVLDTLAQSAASYEEDIRTLAARLLVSYLVRQDTDYLIKRLEDDQKELRLAAVQAIAKKRLRLGDALIARLGDADPDVRQAARTALVKLARGIDHGPEPDASKPERDAAAARWREWWQANR